MVNLMRPKSGTTLTLTAEAWRKSVQDSWKESSTAGLLCRKDPCCSNKDFLNFFPGPIPTMAYVVIFRFTIVVLYKIFFGQKPIWS